MPPKTASDEFDFISRQLKEVARFLCKPETANLVEATFIIGSLHHICYQNAIEFKEPEKPNGH